MPFWNKSKTKKSELPDMKDKVIPAHIAIIMDGNGRWAKKRGMIRTMGHSKGAKVLVDIAKYCNSIGVKHLTLYAFSTENWKRNKIEVDFILNLLKEYIIKLQEEFMGENCRFNFIGDLSAFSDDFNEEMEKAQNSSEKNTGMSLNIAINYGARNEMVNALKQIIREKIPEEQISEKIISDHLYTRDMPDPDLVIRPSGEQRLSNFLLWQSAYSELLFCDTLWPDFTPEHIDEAIEEYNKRNRRFGGV